MNVKGSPSSRRKATGGLRFDPVVVLAIVSALSASTLGAQVPGSVAKDRARLREIRGDTAGVKVYPFITDWMPLLRRVPYAARARLIAIEPDIRYTWNAGIPLSLNDGPLWAGRGHNVSIGFGLGYERPVYGAHLSITVAPTLTYSQNRPFQVFPATTAGRSPYSNPHHGVDASMDLPHRFGNRDLFRLDAGRSAISAEYKGVRATLTASNEVWGPGIRNALVMSANAAGVPRLQLETARPLRTPAGTINARLITGILTESQFFDSDPLNDYRALSGTLVEVRPKFDSMLTLGYARTVYAGVGKPMAGAIGHSFDAITQWTLKRAADQLTALFARWVFPAAGLEVYGELAKADLLKSGDILVTPSRSGAWTFGTQWAQRKRRADLLRLQLEMTNVEQSRLSLSPAPWDFYSGRRAPQGYTQRGQALGAAIGPGASSQWIAVDYLTPQSQLGLFTGRIRWDNDAMYRLNFPTLFKHDVSVFGGLRGALLSKFSDVSAEFTWGYRYNYLFQNGAASLDGRGTVDAHTLTFSLLVSPH